MRGLRKPRGIHPGLEQLKREDQSPGAAVGQTGLVLGRSEAWSDGRGDHTGKERGDQTSLWRCSGWMGQLAGVRPGRARGVLVLLESAKL